MITVGTDCNFEVQDSKMIFSALFQFQIPYIQLFFDMTDVGLDDLIKQDKEKNREKFRGSFRGRGHSRGRGSNDRFNDRPRNNNQRFENDRPGLKTKFIRKNNDWKQDRRREDDNEVEQKPKFKREHVRKQERHSSSEDKKDKPFRTLKVLGLSPQFTNEDLYKLFAAVGALEKCLIQQDNFGRSLTTAIVKYHNEQAARTAIQNLNRHKIMNCVLTVEPYKNVKK